jgi:multidrug efflux pump subunit AcrA (membrane-fusion protein)
MLRSDPATRPRIARAGFCHLCCALFAGAGLVVLTNCHRAEPVAAGPPPPTEVEVTPVEARDVPSVREWIATLDGRVNAEIRAQVSGYLLRQNYREGSFVRQGDLLFEIDARPFEAALNEAKGRLAQAESSVQQAIGNLAQNKARLG